MKTKIKFKGLQTEMLNLYYQDGTMNTREMELFDSQIKYDKETGEEIGADEILNLEAEGVQEINEDWFDLQDYRTSKVSRSKFAKRGVYWSPEDQGLVVFNSGKGTESISSAALFIEETGYEYEADFDEQLNNNVSFTHSDFITDAQKDLNYKFYMGRLAQATNFSKLKIVRESVLAGSKGEHGWFFMKKEDSAKFWVAYNNKKADLNAKKAKRSA